MSSCCSEKNCELEAIAKRQATVLWTVLGINLVMFVVELWSGLLTKSISLTADSLDMLGDAAAYASSLFVLNLGPIAKARSALFKASLMLLSGASVLTMAVYRTLVHAVPTADLMGMVGAAALAANLICLFLLTRHKHDDVNMHSVWLCSRNDIISNTSVLAAASLVHLTNSPWPDLVVGLSVCLLFTWSAASVFKTSAAEMLTA